MKVTKAAVVSSRDSTGKLRFPCHYINTLVIILGIPLKSLSVWFI